MYINIYARIHIYIHIYISYKTFNESDTYLWVGELNAKWLVEQVTFFIHLREKFVQF